MRMLMAISALFLLLTVAASAQTANVSAKPLTDSDIQLLRSDIQADKNEIITHNAVHGCRIQSILAGLS